MTNVIDVLQERGFIEAMTASELKECAKKPLKVYCGFDPTADSLHLGNLVAIMGLAWFQRFGHQPYVLVGGATGMIGDPSGKSVERQFIDEETIQRNLSGIRKNLETILQGTKGNEPVFVNNLDWFKQFSLITFLRDVGKNFRLGPMLAKESVKARLNSEEGMSFTEFCYQILQGYDFLYLHDQFNVTLQLGGSDQWGNITAGMDLIRKVRGEQVFGITFPLLTKSDGQKFGKSEKGAIWLSPDKVSPYEFYQHLFRVSDADVIQLMRMLTFMDMAEIKQYESLMKESNYVPNTAQRRLAEEVTRIVHGEEKLEIAIKVTRSATPGAATELSRESLEAVAKDMPNVTLSKNQLADTELIDLLLQLKLFQSKGEARKFIKNGGLYINNEKILSENYLIPLESLIDHSLLLLALGKKNKILLRVTNS